MLQGRSEVAWTRVVLMKMLRCQSLDVFWRWSQQPTSSMSITRALGILFLSHLTLTASSSPPSLSFHTCCRLCPPSSSLHPHSSHTLELLADLQPNLCPKLWPHITHSLFAYLSYVKMVLVLRLNMSEAEVICFSLQGMASEALLPYYHSLAS